MRYELVRVRVLIIGIVARSVRGAPSRLENKENGDHGQTRHNTIRVQSYIICNTYIPCWSQPPSNQRGGKQKDESEYFLRDR